MDELYLTKIGQRGLAGEDMKIRKKQVESFSLNIV